MNTAETIPSVTIINAGSDYEPHDSLVERVARAMAETFIEDTRPLEKKAFAYRLQATAALAEIFKSPQSAGAGLYNCPPLNTLWSNSLHDQVEPFSWQGGYVWVRWGQKRETRLWAYDEFWDWAIKTGANVRGVAE